MACGLGDDRLIQASPGHEDCEGAGGPSLLDSMFDSVFGRSFAPVLEFESKKALGTDLQCAMKKDPTKAYHLLRSVFVFEEAVELVLSNVLSKLSQFGGTEEYNDLRTLLARVLESRPAIANAN